jgi:YbgC/YbaW family acyl-CoA thioester hydrolase
MRPFVHEVPVRFHDIDFAGIVFFARILYYAHDANEAWLRAIGCRLEVPVSERGFALPFVHAEADYHKPIRGGQTITVEVEPIAVGRTSYTLRSHLFSASGECCATVTTVQVSADPETRRPQPLPEHLRRAVVTQLAADSSGEQGS